MVSKNPFADYIEPCNIICDVMPACEIAYVNEKQASKDAMNVDQKEFCTISPFDMLLSTIMEQPLSNRQLKYFKKKQAKNWFETG